MAFLVEELLEDRQNRQRFFTIRGVRIGVHEVDLLGVRFTSNGVECRHVEVKVSVNPVSYLTRLSKQDQRETGRGGTSRALRSQEQLARGADAWVEKKFGYVGKQSILKNLTSGPWTRELVVHNLKNPEEIELLKARGVTVLFLSDILRELAMSQTVVARASGGDFLDLVLLGSMLGKSNVPMPQATNDLDPEQRTEVGAV